MTDDTGDAETTAEATDEDLVILPTEATDEDVEFAIPFTQE